MSSGPAALQRKQMRHCWFTLMLCCPDQSPRSAPQMTSSASARRAAAEAAAQFPGHLSGDGYPTSGQAEHHRIVPLLILQLTSELAVGVGTVGEGLVGECFHITGCTRQEMTQQVYGELLHRAGALLSRGESVVIDASWTRDADRRRAHELALATASDLIALQCTAPAELATQRLQTRGPTPSDADENVARAMTADADPWPEATDLPTGGTRADTLTRAVTVLAHSGLR